MSAKVQGKAVALGDFTGQKEQNQITSLKKGDSVTILNKIPVAGGTEFAKEAVKRAISQRHL